MTDQVLEKFWDRIQVDEVTGCWNWTAGKSQGYGEFYFYGKMQRCHKITYELKHGKVPKGLHLDHLCRNTACCNPDHLEAVTPRTNILRGIGIASQNSKKMFCKRGHEFTFLNTYWNNKSGERCCRECTRIRSRK